MNTKLVSSIEAATRSRLVVVREGTLLLEVARLLSDTQISLIVVCDAVGAMTGIITKTDIVQRVGHCPGAACTATAAEIMTRDVTCCGVTDCLPDVLSMMQVRGFVHVPIAARVKVVVARVKQLSAEYFEPWRRCSRLSRALD